MESTLYTISKTLNCTPTNPFISRLHRHLCTTRRSQLASLQLRRLLGAEFRAYSAFGSISGASNPLGSLSAPLPPFGCAAASSAASFASGGGGGGIGGSGGGSGSGGGDGASDGGNAKSVAEGAEEASALSPDVIILDVGGMTCGGCAASVKRILENQPQVSSASVNLATETAIIWPASEAKVVPNWQKLLGETLAKHLTSCGFKSNLRGKGALEGEIPS